MCFIFEEDEDEHGQDIQIHVQVGRGKWEDEWCYLKCNYLMLQFHLRSLKHCTLLPQNTILINGHLINTIYVLGGPLLWGSQISSQFQNLKGVNCEVITLHALCQPVLVKAAWDGRFEQFQTSQCVIWPCVIAVLYWAVCLSCQTRSSSLGDAARSFTSYINLGAPWWGTAFDPPVFSYCPHCYPMWKKTWFYYIKLVSKYLSNQVTFVWLKWNKWWHWTTSFNRQDNM